MALLTKSPLWEAWDSLDDAASLYENSRILGDSPGLQRVYDDNRFEEPDDQIGKIINVLPLPFKECPNCDRPLKPLMRGQIRMEPTKELDSLESGRAVICSECKHFITQEYAPVNEKWVYENYEHPFSKCVRMAMAHPVTDQDLGRLRPATATLAICAILREVVVGCPDDPIHPEVDEFKEVSEGLFATLVKRRMTQKEVEQKGKIGRMDTVRFVQTLPKDLYQVLNMDAVREKMVTDLDAKILFGSGKEGTRTATETTLTLESLNIAKKLLYAPTS